MSIKITVSGPVGSGKTHILARVEQYLRGQGLDVTCDHDETTEDMRADIANSELPSTIMVQKIILEERKKPWTQL